MHDANAWNVNLGRWGGIRVRLHGLFLLFGVFTMYLGYLADRQHDAELMGYGAMALAVLFVSVLLHELAHCYTAIHLGGRAEQIIIGPLGGLAQVNVPHEPRSELLAAAAGPALNLLLCLVTAPLLLVVGETNILGLLNPLLPRALVEGSPQVVFLKMTFWLNWLLAIVNLLPAYPFDGGRMLRAALWPVAGYQTSIILVARFAWFTSFALCVVAWLMRGAFGGALVPAWLPLVMMAIFLFFSANQAVARGEKREVAEDELDYDFSQGFTSLDREPEPPPVEQPGMLRRWMERRRREKERLLREQEEADDRRMDEILAQLHITGMDGLSPEDRALLKRVSARYRNRLKP